MSATRKRPRVEIARAVHRLTSEPLKTLEELSAACGTPAETLRRWAVDGNRGVYLDALHRPGAGWLSSAAALERFKLALAAQTGGAG